MDGSATPAETDQLQCGPVDDPIVEHDRGGHPGHRGHSLDRPPTAAAARLRRLDRYRVRDRSSAPARTARAAIDEVLVELRNPEHAAATR
ncbi:hypothetical protein BJF90_44230 [Pseudonocardia sp. CNS-004]|nr:hypothetical protein BJF90_44230 [Pseudonocardia sp. CNS-004]